MGTNVSKLGTICTCDKTESPEEILKLFYNEIEIRNTTIEVIARTIQSKKKTPKEITKIKFEQIRDQFLISKKDDKKKMDDFWNKAIETIRKNSNECYFFGALLILGQKNKEQFLTWFPQITTKICPNKNLFTEGKILKEELEKFLFAYIFIISQLGIDILKLDLSKELEIDRLFSPKFSDENIKKYINYFFEEKYKEEQIDFSAFFNEYYDKITDDDAIRTDLYNMK